MSRIPKNQGWIDVKKELPPLWKEVETLNKYGSVRIAKRILKYNSYYFDNATEVIAWRYKNSFPGGELKGHQERKNYET